jgi:hypothetical protein
MTNSISWKVVVTKTTRDGWYVYTSDNLPGLYVASRDDNIALRDLSESIKQLVLLDFGIEVEVDPVLPFEADCTTVPSDEQAKEILDKRTADLMADGDGTLTLVMYRAAAVART